MPDIQVEAGYDCAKRGHLFLQDHGFCLACGADRTERPVDISGRCSACDRNGDRSSIQQGATRILGRVTTTEYVCSAGHKWSVERRKEAA